MGEVDAGRHVIDTASGVRLNLDCPTPQQIRIEDIAGGLSKVCRFGAQTRQFFSVAQHALGVRDLVVRARRPDLALVALHHDSHEAYLCDVPKPLKQKIAVATDVYEQTCHSIDQVIATAFGFRWPQYGSPDWKVIKRADTEALLVEAALLLPELAKILRQRVSTDPLPLFARSAPPKPLSPLEAQETFLQAHRELTSSDGPG